MSSFILLASDQSMFDPASPAAESIRSLAFLVVAITGVIFVLVEGRLVYAIARFRRPPGGATEKEPPQVYGGQPIEIAWAAPARIVVVLVLVTARTLWGVNPTPPPPRPDDHGLYVTVIGHPW